MPLFEQIRPIKEQDKLHSQPHRSQNIGRQKGSPSSLEIIFFGASQFWECGKNIIMLDYGVFTYEK